MQDTGRTQLMLCLIFELCLIFAFAGGGVVTEDMTGGGWSTVTFDVPTTEPGANVEGIPVISGSMPIGNGETTAIVFPLDNPLETDGFKLEEGVHVWVSADCNGV